MKEGDYIRINIHGKTRIGKIEIIESGERIRGYKDEALWVTLLKTGPGVELVSTPVPRKRLEKISKEEYLAHSL